MYGRWLSMNKRKLLLAPRKKVRMLNSVHKKAEPKIGQSCEIIYLYRLRYLDAEPHIASAGAAALPSCVLHYGRPTLKMLLESIPPHTCLKSPGQASPHSDKPFTGRGTGWSQGRPHAGHPFWKEEEWFNENPPEVVWICLPHYGTLKGRGKECVFHTHKFSHTPTPHC